MSTKTRNALFICALRCYRVKCADCEEEETYDGTQDDAVDHFEEEGWEANSEEPNPAEVLCPTCVDTGKDLEDEIADTEPSEDFDDHPGSQPRCDP